MKDREVVNIITTPITSKKIKHILKRNNINRLTTTIVHGTLKNKILNFLELNRVKKELITFDTSNSKKIIKDLETNIDFDKKNKGIVYVLSNKNKEDNMYSLITVIVEKGIAEDVVAVSNKHGGKGATIINARGSSKIEEKKLFKLSLEPEKEIVLILVPNKISDSIVEKIETELSISELGKGIIYTQNVEKVVGIVK